MSDRIQRAFCDIHADDALLQKTAAYLEGVREKGERKQSSPRPLRLVGALAAMLVLVVGIFGYHGFYYSAATYVSIDVNPSVELTLNRMDKVIAATAYNTDGEALLQSINVSGKPYDEAVSMLLTEMVAQGYFTDDTLVTMTVQTADGVKEQTLCNNLLQSMDGQSAAEVEVFPVTQEVREMAHGCQMSAAKYLAIQELMEVDETAKLEDYSNSTIRQILQRAQVCRDGHEGDSSSGNGNHGYGGGQAGNQNQDGGQNQGNGQGNGHGHGGK